MSVVAKYRLGILIAVVFLSIIVLMITGPIPQDLSYHDFGDQRIIFQIPNFWDVVSNVPMFFIGIIGMYLGIKNIHQRPDFVSKAIPVVLSLGILSASFGSAYYHYAPDNDTLVWDRLPMTLMFMALFSLIVYDFMGVNYGKVTFYSFVPLGIISVLYWGYTESIGAGDLRMYALVQFLPMLVAPLIILFFPKKVDYIRYILLILLWYIIAKVSEHFDKEIFDILTFWSGHTIKHFLGAISLYYAIIVILSWEKNLQVKSNNPLTY